MCMLNKEECIQILRQDVTPALGCTEPACVAFCVATASHLLKESIVYVDVQVNIGIYKNGMSVGIPNFDRVGLEYAASLGCFLNPNDTLRIFEGIDDLVCQRAIALCEHNQVKVMVDPNEKDLYVKCVIHTKNETTTCIIQHEHTNVVYLEKDGDVLIEENKESLQGFSKLIPQLQSMKICDILDVVNTLNVSDIEFLQDGIDMNEKLVEYAKKNVLPLSNSFNQKLSKDIFSSELLSKLIFELTSSIEARLSGCPLSTMASSGAGTKGLAIILPLHVIASHFQIQKEKELKALALAHLLNRYINTYIGKLAPMCTCVMASSMALSASIVYMFDGNYCQIESAIINMTGTVTGMICDGGKVGCSLKVTSGTMSALLCAITALNDATLKSSDGIVGASAEQCIQNIAVLAKEGMNHLDSTIVKIMQTK